LAFIFALICLSILIFIFRYNLRNNVTQIDIYLLTAVALGLFFFAETEEIFCDFEETCAFEDWTATERWTYSVQRKTKWDNTLNIGVWS